MEDFGADMFYTELDKVRDQLEMGYPNLKWVIPVLLDRSWVCWGCQMCFLGMVTERLGGIG